MQNFIVVTPFNQILIYELKEFKLETMQRIVGGLITSVPNKHSLEMYTNDEGLLEGLPINDIASAVYGYDYIVGNVFIVDVDHEEGEWIGLSDQKLQETIELLKSYGLHEEVVDKREEIRALYNEIVRSRQ